MELKLMTSEKKLALRKNIKKSLYFFIPMVLFITVLWGFGGLNARDNALRHANLDKNDVSYIRFSFDLDDLIPQYEVSWYQGTREMEYTVHAISGSLLEIDS